MEYYFAGSYLRFSKCYVDENTTIRFSVKILVPNDSFSQHQCLCRGACCKFSSWDSFLCWFSNIMGLYAFGFHKFYSIIIRYIWLITAIDTDKHSTISHTNSVSHSFTIFHNSFQHIHNSFATHLNTCTFLSLTISLVFIVFILSSDFSYCSNFFPDGKFNVWRTLCTSSSLGWPQVNTNSLTCAHSVLFTKMLRGNFFQCHVFTMKEGPEGGSQSHFPAEILAKSQSKLAKSQSQYWNPSQWKTVYLSVE